MAYALPTISLDIDTGTSFGEAFLHARHIAKVLQVRAAFTFNGDRVAVRADDTEEEVFQCYMDRLRASKKGE